MNISKPTITGYNPLDAILNTQTAQAKQATGQIEYDGSKIDNLSLQSGKLVSFMSQDGNNVRVYLDNSTVDKLQSKFGTDSLSSVDSNTLQASGKAEEYLSGFWKVAQSNILSADKDSNGIIKGNEVLDVKVNAEGGGDIDVRKGTMAFSTEGLQSISDDKFLSQDAKNKIAGQFGATSVDALFNQLLQYDKNSDGNLNVGELVSLDSLNTVYSDFASNDGLALYKEVKIGNKTIKYREYIASAEDVKQSEKNKRAKQEQDVAIDSDEKQKAENKKEQESEKIEEQIYSSIKQSKINGESLVSAASPA